MIWNSSSEYWGISFHFNLGMLPTKCTVLPLPVLGHHPLLVYNNLGILHNKIIFWGRPWAWLRLAKSLLPRSFFFWKNWLNKNNSPITYKTEQHCQAWSRQPHKCTCTSYYSYSTRLLANMADSLIKYWVIGYPKKLTLC